MGTGSTLAAFASLDHVRRLWEPTLCSGFGLFVRASDTLQAVLEAGSWTAIDCIDVRFAAVLRQDHGGGSVLAVADVGSRSSLVGRVRIAGENGTLGGLAGVPCAPITFNDMGWKPGSPTSVVPAKCCWQARWPTPPPSVSHHV